MRGLDGWVRAKLGDIATVIPGQSPPGSSYNEEMRGTPFFQGKAEFGATHPAVRKYTTAGTKFAEPDDVLLSVRAPVGPTNVADRHCAIGRGLMAVRAGDRVDPRYLLWVLRAHADVLAAQATGSTFVAVSGKQVRDLKLPVAPLAEQRRIIDVLEEHLSNIDAASDLLESSRRRLRHLRASALTREIERGGSRLRLGSLLHRIESGRSLGTATRPAGDSEWGIVRVSSMTWGVFKPEENKFIDSALANPAYEIRDGDVLMSRANTSEYVGAAVLVRNPPPRRLLSDKSLRVVPRDDVDPEWLALLLSSPSSRRQLSAAATGTKDSMRNLSRASIEGILVPDFAPIQQTAVIRRMSTLDSSITYANSEIAALRDRSIVLRRAVLAAAFSGKLTGAPSDAGRIEDLAAAQ